MRKRAGAVNVTSFVDVSVIARVAPHGLRVRTYGLVASNLMPGDKSRTYHRSVAPIPCAGISAESSIPYG